MQGRTVPGQIEPETSSNKGDEGWTTMSNGVKIREKK
jgi:hypothetical protein